MQKFQINIPDKVKVAWLTYEIRISEVDDLILEKENLLGHCIHAEQVIRVKSTLKDDQKQVVFLHEVLHAVAYAGGVSFKNEEEVVEKISSTLYQVLTENNLLIKCPTLKE